MYVTSLLAGRDGSMNRNQIRNPTWTEIKSTIFALDGRDHRTIMMLKEYEEEEQKDDVKELMEIAGGGRNGLYICLFCSEEDDYEWYLHDPSKSDEETIEIARTDPTMCSPSMCFDRDTILVVAETYARYGERDKSFHWRGWPGSLSVPIKIESPSVE
ncbi:hypothetical protein CKA32_005397 [Geitlerinema sp. FC II]|nr:hypothetical protein CKA32_005397 [Geitlerinema sp. FC II]